LSSGHLIEELKGWERRSARMESVRRVRAVFLTAVGRDLVPATERESCCKSLKALFRTRTGDPLLTMEVLYQLS
jgi:hypothetical protein